MSLSRLYPLALVSVLAASVFAGCAAPAEDAAGGQGSAQNLDDTTANVVTPSETNVLGRVLASSTARTLDGITWTFFELKVPVDVVGNDREIVVVAVTGDSTYTYRIDEQASGLKLSKGATPGKIEFAVDYDSRDPQRGLVTDTLPMVLTYETKGGVLAPKLATAGGAPTPLAPIADESYRDLDAVYLVREPITLSAEIEANVLQVVGDAAVNPLSLVIAARTRDKNSAFFVGMVGDVTSVKKSGNVLEIAAVEETLGGEDFTETLTKDITIRVELDPALGTAKVTRR